MLPLLINNLKNGEVTELSDCSQNWDYLDVEDAAEALIALGENGHSGEIYNLARGDNKTLREYVVVAEEKFAKQGGLVRYGERINPFISLRPSVAKLKEHTGWSPKIDFLELVK
ncbi:MAG: NAD-dependent epimerase/dehydratase family protein [Lachnospiraceae bacterium]|nr:NAD-dependent epimerase/dehydratase family protein [Lachnospiraceae bacterium]